MKPFIWHIIVCILILFIIVYVKPNTYEVPKIIWTHWDTEKLPELVQKIHARTRHILYDWQINFITTQQFLDKCPPGDIPNGFDTLSLPHKADFIRLWLLKKYGGCWMDISILLNQSINSIYEECILKRAEVAGFYIEGLTRDMKYPVFENWFIMAPRNSSLIRYWYDEYYRAIERGFYNYKKDCQRSGVNLQGIFHSDTDIYLTQHLCFQKVLQQYYFIPPITVLYKAEDTMFNLRKLCWDNSVNTKECYKKIYTVDNIRRQKWIKLTSGCRENFPKNIVEQLDYM